MAIAAVAGWVAALIVGMTIVLTIPTDRALDLARADLADRPSTL